MRPNRRNYFFPRPYELDQRLFQQTPRLRRRAWVRADVAIHPLGIFISDAIVHLSHGRPSSHRPRPRPSA
jgi:hypothetical protein